MIGRATLSENSVIASPMLFFNPLNGKMFHRTTQGVSAGGAEEVATKFFRDIRSILFSDLIVHSHASLDAIINNAYKIESIKVFESLNTLNIRSQVKKIQIIFKSIIFCYLRFSVRYP